MFCNTYKTKIHQKWFAVKKAAANFFAAATSA